MSHWRAAAILAVVLAGQVTSSGAQQAPLVVSGSDGWRGLWRPDAQPPTRWARGDTALLATLQWRQAQGGMTYAQLPVRGDGEAWRTRVVVVRIDPRTVRFRLDTAFALRRDADGNTMRRASWRVEDAASSTILAVNAGQFDATFLGTLPWGWVVLGGHEWRAPGIGPLSSAVVIDTSGAVRLLPVTSLVSPTRANGVRDAFQSFPTLLQDDGVVPAALQDGAIAIDLTHRDARLAIGVRRDGTVLVVMTRFDVFGRTFGAVPFGFTTPEMAALMGALGCARAVMLDGGISAQLQLRDATDTMQRWSGSRRVPMGLVVQRR